MAQWIDENLAAARGGRWRPICAGRVHHAGLGHAVRVAVVGAGGRVGATFAYTLLLSDLAAEPRHSAGIVKATVNQLSLEPV